jgi:hypothetical protein
MGEAERLRAVSEEIGLAIDHAACDIAGSGARSSSKARLARAGARD